MSQRLSALHRELQDSLDCTETHGQKNKKFNVLDTSKPFQLWTLHLKILIHRVCVCVCARTHVCVRWGVGGEDSLDLALGRVRPAAWQ